MGDMAYKWLPVALVGATAVADAPVAILYGYVPAVREVVNNVVLDPKTMMAAGTVATLVAAVKRRLA